MQDTLRRMIDQIAQEEAARLERQAEAMIAAGHQVDELTIMWHPLSGTQEVVLKNQLAAAPFADRFTSDD